jgi:hypothetical protein
MLNSSRVRIIAVPWRKICAWIPAVALMGAGIAWAAPAQPALVKLVAVSKNSPAIVVPQDALTMPPVPPPIRTGHFPVAAPVAPALVLPVGTLPGSSAPVALDSTGVPVRALEAYRKAATLVGAADPACHIDWALLGAIGRVESNHARFGGNQLDSAGVAQPGIIGIALDGTNGTARILDTDHGVLDRDTVYDRAVGPMQFIPSTWAVAGADGNGDGVKNPENMADAATATAIYLCSGPGDLSVPADLHSAIMRYNASDSYVRTVTAIAAAYRSGVTALPASDLPAANPAPSTTGTATAAPSPAARVLAARVLAARALAARALAAHVAAAPVPTVSVPTVPVPTPTLLTAPTPTAPVPTVPVPTAPSPTAPSPTAPVQCVPAPTVPVPTPTDPTAPVPTVPAPTPTDPTAPIPCVAPTLATSSTLVPPVPTPTPTL